MNQIIDEIVKRIKKAQTISIFCHTNPDGDTLTCGLALQSAIKALGKECLVFCDTVIPEHFYCLKGAKDISLPVKRNFDLAISVDASDLDRLGSANKSFLSAKSHIVIDHHRTHQKFADCTLLNADAAACAEIMFDVLDALNGLNDETAALLFAGMVTDSGCFSFPSTTKNTMEVASKLREFNFDPAQVIYDVFKRTNIRKFNLKNRVLSKAKFYSDNKIGIIIFRNTDFEATETTTADTDGIINNIIDIDSCEVAIAISEVNSMSYKVSFRTKALVDASDCAMTFGGGGHKQAAGCRINGYLEDIIEKLLKVANDRL